MPSILVLEDSYERIKWLKEVFKDALVRVIWHKTVTDAAECLRHCVPDVVILDHDLGDDAPASLSLYGSGYNETGIHRQTGMDLIPHLPEGQPVLVWTNNVVAGPRMVHALRERGIPHVRAPFSPTDGLSRLIRGMLELRTTDEATDPAAPG